MKMAFICRSFQPSKKKFLFFTINWRAKLSHSKGEEMLSILRKAELLMSVRDKYTDTLLFINSSPFVECFHNNSVKVVLPIPAQTLQIESYSEYVYNYSILSYFVAFIEISWFVFSFWVLSFYLEKAPFQQVCQF